MLRRADHSMAHDLMAALWAMSIPVDGEFLVRIHLDPVQLIEGKRLGLTPAART